MSVYSQLAKNILQPKKHSTHHHLKIYGRLEVHKCAHDSLQPGSQKPSCMSPTAHESTHNFEPRKHTTTHMPEVARTCDWPACRPHPPDKHHVCQSRHVPPASPIPRTPARTMWGRQARRNSRRRCAVHVAKGITRFKTTAARTRQRGQNKKRIAGWNLRILPRRNTCIPLYESCHHLL